MDEIKLLSMNLLHIAPISKNLTSGISNSVLNLTEAQARNNLKVGVISSKKTESLFSKNIKFTQIANLSIFRLLFLYPIKNLLNFFKDPDIIIFHDIYNIRQSILMFKMVFLRKKILITPRGAFSEVALRRSFFKKRIYYYLFLKPILNKIYAFIALNENEKIQIQKFISGKKIIIINNGINNNSEIYEKYKKNYELKEKNNSFTIGYFGRFDIHIKGLDLLLNSLVNFQLKYKSKQIILVLIGDHVDKIEYSSKVFINLIKSKLVFPDNLIIKGPFHSEIKWEELSKVDILIQPSRTEGMPNSVLEAMSIGIPCCVSEFTNMKGIIENANNGWVIELNSISIMNFFEKITSFAKKDLLHMGVNGMHYAQKHLLWDKVCMSDYE